MWRKNVTLVLVATGLLLLFLSNNPRYLEVGTTAPGIAMVLLTGIVTALLAGLAPSFNDTGQHPKVFFWPFLAGLTVGMIHLLPIIRQLPLFAFELLVLAGIVLGRFFEFIWPSDHPTDTFRAAVLGFGSASALIMNAYATSSWSLAMLVMTAVIAWYEYPLALAFVLSNREDLR